MKASAYHRCLAVGMHFTEHSGALSEERHFPDKPSRLKRILWLICVPLFLSLAAMVWGLDAIRLAVSP